MSEAPTSGPRDARLASATDVCVKCGLCLPQCPTYLKTADENESPRGRLSLIQGWAQGALELTPKLTAHVDHCLLCRSCEAVCPANVAYGKIVDDFRAHIHDQRPSGTDDGHGLINNAVLGFLKGGQPRILQSGLSRLARTAAGQGIAKQLGLDAMTKGLPDSIPGLRTISPGHYPTSRAEPAGNVQLFLGCTSTLLDAQTLDATVSVLNTIGINIDIPEKQGCCGALDLHAGAKSEAQTLQHQNQAAFEGGASTPIISFASGCGAALNDYGNDPESVGRRHVDISAYLDRMTWPDELAIAPLNTTALLHTPCSLRNVQKTPDAPLRLLAKIPGLKILSLPTSIRCCGAAGSFMLNYPEEAQSYRKEILDRITEASPSILLSSNPGCAAHLRAGLRDLGLEVEVIHPVTLLWRQIRAASQAT